MYCTGENPDGHFNQATANILAMFRLIQEMRAKDKVLCIAFAVCAAFMFGDHLAFTANFQPNMILPILTVPVSYSEVWRNLALRMFCLFLLQ